MPDISISSNSSRKKELAAKLRSQPPKGTWSAFREVEKKYLSRNPPPDFSDVIDLDDIEHSNKLDDIQQYCFDHSAWHDDDSPVADLFKEHAGYSSLKVYALQSHPGALFIPSALTAKAQRQLVRTCLRDATRPPNINNLDTHYILPKEGIWNAYESQCRSSADEDLLIEPLAGRSGSSDSGTAGDGPRQLIANKGFDETVSIDTLKIRKEQPVPSSTVKPELLSKSIYKLRWTNLGLLYHWTTKSYHFDQVIEEGPAAMIPVPKDLAAISKYVLTSIPNHLIHDEQNWTDYQPESGIINFYQTKDTLMGHVDHSELVEGKPLVSISLGQTAVFLLGGKTRDDRPVAIYLRSGDILVMSGPSRRAYHGIPRIIEGSLPQHLSRCDSEDLDIDERGADWNVFANYLATTRININIRQVFPSGFFTKLSEA